MRTRADGVLMYHKGDDGRCFVPSDKRRPLVLTTHERMFHLGALKVYSHLKRYYWWPVMRQTIIDILAPCKECQLTKGKQYRAHKMWRSPRRWPQVSVAAFTLMRESARHHASGTQAVLAAVAHGVSGPSCPPAAAPGLPVLGGFTP